MNRRSALAAIGTATIAGCVSDGSDSEVDERDEPDESDDVQGDDWTVVGSAESDLLEVNFSQMYLREWLRYYDQETDQLERLEPQRGLWVQASVRIRNLGGEPVSAPSTSEFELISGGKQIESRAEFPESLEWDDLRLREDGRWYWMDLGYTGGADPIDSGDDELLYLLFDAPEEREPLLSWSGVESDTLLEPGYVHVPERMESN